jgi:sporadic carbohydrate cluster protein (TIGR04323 family)
MTTAIINTDMNIGPFKIPGNGQNMILNNYAERNKFIVEAIIPEPFKSNALATTQWIHKEKKLKKVILCSIHQLPSKKTRINDLIKNMKNVEFHFALEGISGKGKFFLLDCIKEAKIFKKAKIIDSTKTSWSDLYKLKIKKGTK